MRIVQLNLAADHALRDPDSLLDSYHTLTGWSEALAAAGATVSVVQRFSHDARRTRGDVLYEFVADGQSARPSPWTLFPRVAAAIQHTMPGVIHINGLMFPGMVHQLRAAHPEAAIVLQDHSGAVPRRLPRLLGAVRARRWCVAFQHADACSVTSRELLTRWRALGLPPEMRVLEIPEASTRLAPIDRRAAQARTGMHGTPVLLWVGRLDRNKDPMTMLAGLAPALMALPGAQLWMIAPEGGLREAVTRRINVSEVLRHRVTIIGPVPHRAMPAYYSSADIFISASHHEGSGYALLEAMACGVAPCVTDIPSFRALTAGCAALWPAGNADAFARALCVLAGSDLAARRAAAAHRFDEALSWRAVGRQTLDAYRGLVAARRARS